MNEMWITTIVFALATTLMFGALGFNRPSWSRSYTTAARYRIAVVAHVGLYVIVLLIVYAVLRRAVPAMGETELSKISMMWIALALTGCLRAVPALSRRPREWLHRMSGIPEQAARFAKFLADTELKADESFTAQAQSMLLHRGIDAERDWLPLAQPVHRQLLRATTLFIQLREWDQQPRLAPFVREARNDLDQLRQRFDRLSLRVSRTLSSIERLGEIRHLFTECTGATDAPAGCDAATHEAQHELDEHLRRLVSDMIADVCEDISFFYRDACVLVARGVITTEPTRKGRDKAVARLGFANRRRDMPNAYGTLLVAAVLLYVGIWLFFLILPPRDHVLEPSPLVAVITLNVLGALAIAILPKRHWGFANAGLRRKTPVPFVVGAGACAVLFAVGVNLVAGALLLGGWHGAWMRLQDGAAYLHSPFFTAATVAWLIQDHRWRDTASARRRRLLDAATLAAMWVISTLIAQALLVHSVDAFMAGPTLASISVALVFGGVIGFAIPGSVRDDALRPAASPFALPLSDFDAGAAASRSDRAAPPLPTLADAGRAIA